MFEVNILVNGNRCKQYYHAGKTFIEAKHGSEYEIEIKNNTYKRVLAVSSVDGLDVLTGNSASEDDNGYIIDAYHPVKIKGFRYSNNDVGAFRFSSKHGSYAASKHDGSEKNVGIIGVRIFDEKIWPAATVVNPIWVTPPPPYNPHPYWVDWYWTTNGQPTYGGGGTTCNSGLGSDSCFGEKLMDMSDDVQSRADYSCKSGPTKYSANITRNVKSRGFDMGTQWGTKKESKIQEVSFERGCLSFSLDIYYASRESLIDMGVPITNVLKANLPQSFPEKYAKPPKGWVG